MTLRNNREQAHGRDSEFRIALADCPVPEAQRSSDPRPRIATIHLTFMFRNHDRGVLLPRASAETCASLRRRMLTLSPRRRTLVNLTTRFHERCDRHRGTRRARRYRHPQAVFFLATGGTSTVAMVAITDRLENSLAHRESA